MRGIVAVVAVAVLAAGCTAGSAADTAVTSSTATSTTTAATTTTAPERRCDPEPSAGPARIDPGDPVAAAVELSAATFPCAIEVTLAPAGGATAIGTAARHAASVGGPVLLVDGAVRGDVAAEIRRLDPDLITIVGLAGATGDVLAAYPLEVLPPSGADAAPVPIRLDRPGRVWLVGADGEDLWPIVWAIARTAGDTALRPGVDDLRTMAPIDVAALRAGSGAPLTTVGVGDLEWTLEVVLAGRELPGGGFLLLPGRRLVALYGNPTTPVLGVLGEQGPEAGLERLRELAAPYGADGVPILPAFEIIATVADARAGADGDYSAEMGVETLRPWVETAAALGIYVILDLQPGRTDFLTQAKRYEEFLRLPHVGLALDPEWRLGPTQVHLRQIGTVDAAEINEVSAWLADIVREEALPQKLLLLHQFRFSMITNRDRVETPPELAVVIQMDGQGPLPTKYETWNALTGGTEDAGWLWGWKNFFDEDSPMATAGQVLDLEPVPVYVSFQ